MTHVLETMDRFGWNLSAHSIHSLPPGTKGKHLMQLYIIAMILAVAAYFVSTFIFPPTAFKDRLEKIDPSDSIVDNEVHHVLSKHRATFSH